MKTWLVPSLVLAIAVCGYSVRSQEPVESRGFRDFLHEIETTGKCSCGELSFQMNWQSAKASIGNESILNDSLGNRRQRQSAINDMVLISGRDDLTPQQREMLYAARIALLSQFFSIPDGF